MKNYSYAAAFAFIGLGIGLWIAVELDIDITLSIIIGACLGGFIGFFVAGLQSAKSTILQENFKNLGVLKDRTLEDIESHVGTHTSFTTCNISDRNNEEGFLYTWMENNYMIVLLFDKDLKCIGVSKETAI